LRRCDIDDDSGSFITCIHSISSGSSPSLRSRRRREEREVEQRYWWCASVGMECPVPKRGDRVRFPLPIACSS
jgi:hypothetical protein